LIISKETKLGPYAMGFRGDHYVCLSLYIKDMGKWYLWF